MPDPFRRSRPGERPTTDTRAWNAMLAAGEGHERGALGGGARRGREFRQADIVRVKNESGADVGRCGVLGIDVPVFEPYEDEEAFLREVAFRGVTPTGAHATRFAVLLEPAAAGAIARAYVAGVCPVMVDMTAEAHTRAGAIDGETGHLGSSGDGPAQILWREGEAGGYGYYDGLQWAVVRLGTPLAPPVGVIPCTTGPDGIGAMDGDIYGMGHVDLDGVVLHSDGVTATMATATTPAVAYSGFTVAVPGLTRAKVAYGAAGLLWVVGADCVAG